MTLLKIAQFQLTVLEDKAASLAQLERYFQEIASEKVDLVTLPEMFCCPYAMENFPVYAEKEGGFIWSACADLARRYGVYFSAGSVPEEEEGCVFNTAYVFDRSGRQIGKHRKMHLFDIDVPGGQCFKESDTLSPGNAVTTFDTEFGRVGLCICYDFRFPELGRLMTLQGARLILVPAAFNMTTGPAHWEITFRAQALSNQIFAVGTAPARDLQASYPSWGHSLVVEPWGSAVQEMDEKAGIQITEIDLDRTEVVRSQLPLLKHRRSDIYG